MLRNYFYAAVVLLMCSISIIETRKLVIQTRPDINNGAQVANSYGKLSRAFPHYHSYAMEVADDMDLDILRNDERIISVSEDGIGVVETINDPLVSQQWALDTLQTEQVWKSHFVDPDLNIIVAICDSGLNFEHEDLPIDAIRGPDYIDEDDDPSDSGDHGTHVAGIIAATANNSLGIAGFAPGIKLWIGKVFSAFKSSSNSIVAACIDGAREAGAHVINISINGGYSELAEMAVNQAVAAGIFVAACGGNSGSGYSYPGAYNQSFSVGSITSTLERSGFSNVGDHQDAMAPGDGILSTIGGVSGYGVKSGCSMATPYMAAVVALLKSAKPSLTGLELRAIIEKTAIDLGEPGKDDSFGMGLVNPLLALRYVQNVPPVVSPTELTILVDTIANITLTCSGPEDDDDCSMTLSDLPDFLTETTINSSRIEMFGIAEEAGEFYFSISAVDEFDGFTQQRFTIIVANPPTNPGSSPNSPGLNLGPQYVSSGIQFAVFRCTILLVYACTMLFG